MVPSTNQHNYPHTHTPVHYIGISAGYIMYTVHVITSTLAWSIPSYIWLNIEHIVEYAYGLVL